MSCVMLAGGAVTLPLLLSRKEKHTEHSSMTGNLNEQDKEQSSLIATECLSLYQTLPNAIKVHHTMQNTSLDDDDNNHKFISASTAYFMQVSLRGAGEVGQQDKVYSNTSNNISSSSSSGSGGISTHNSNNSSNNNSTAMHGGGYKVLNNERDDHRNTGGLKFYLDKAAQTQRQA
uniref:Uncharacterized protein n=1 Tax=Lygus hesperus TaxID=30085 RepID=A0A0A9W5K9_LYGHE